MPLAIFRQHVHSKSGEHANRKRHLCVILFPSEASLVQAHSLEQVQLTTNPDTFLLFLLDPLAKTVDKKHTHTHTC